jgi:hypothetical protein
MATAVKPGFLRNFRLTRESSVRRGNIDYLSPRETESPVEKFPL